MLVNWNDVLVAQERNRDLLKKAEAHRAGIALAGNRQELVTGSIGKAAIQLIHRLGGRFVNAGKVMQRRYAG